MDIIQLQVTSISSDLQQYIEQVVHEVKTMLRTEFIGALNKKVVSLEARVNEVCQDTTSTLEELKTTMVAVHESLEKMRRSINRMSKEV